MEPLPADEIRRSFVHTSKSRAKALTLPKAYAELPWEELDFLGWRDQKAPNRGYLVLRHDGRTVGLELTTAASGRPRRGAALCDLCRSTHQITDVALFVARRAGTAGREGNTVGTYICADLACSLYVRGLKELELPQSDTASPADRARRLRDQVTGFVNRCLAA